MLPSAICVVLILRATCVFGGPLSPINSEPDVQGYLQRFGYLQAPNPETGSLVTHEHFSEAVKQFQSFASLPTTGILDAETKRMMNAPRCGVPDITDEERPTENGQTHRRRRKRFVHQGSKWRVKDLTWSVSQPTSQLTRNDVETQIARAWKLWSDNSDLTFTKSNGGNVHIDIRFAKYEHGDGDSFDGPGKTLAHAFFPQYGGDAHFDDSEPWTVGRYGTNLFQVAAHEFGHSLGLSHSNVKSSLMAPFYRGYDDNLHLDPDDIAAIQGIYGPPRRSGSGWNRLSSQSSTSRRPFDTGSSRKTPVIPPTSESSAAICKSPSIDALTTTSDGKTYAFKDDLYYQLNDYGVEPGYPKKISDDWSGLPANLDAALTWSDGKTFFFKGGKYWRFLNKKALPGYPKLISKGFAGIPNDVDAAFVWSGNSKTYFIKGTKYWRYDSAIETPVSADYPKSLSAWDGLPNHIDAAFQWKNAKTFFFSGNQYYRFNDQRFTVETDYPRQNGPWWFGCGSDSTKDFVDHSVHTHLVEEEQADSADFSDTMNDALAPSQENIFTVVREDKSAAARKHLGHEESQYVSQAQYSNSAPLNTFSASLIFFVTLTAALFHISRCH
ncbi:Matrix metalloproteinase-16 [Hypsibius exemplaris]|uniref:Matrix metalloproteinase-16 n=1 Tax=Hypsibius exemplaris TaxID=2072580 RepID=A0A1W0XBN1_HYPEX|nr:Matrix metalloproteinase-16 [Hypsibius exemplaris]